MPDRAVVDPDGCAFEPVLPGAVVDDKGHEIAERGWLLRVDQVVRHEPDIGLPLPLRLIGAHR